MLHGSRYQGSSQRTVELRYFNLVKIAVNPVYVACYPVDRQAFWRGQAMFHNHFNGTDTCGKKKKGKQTCTAVQGGSGNKPTRDHSSKHVSIEGPGRKPSKEHWCQYLLYLFFLNSPKPFQESIKHWGDSNQRLQRNCFLFGVFLAEQEMY